MESDKKVLNNINNKPFTNIENKFTDEVILTTEKKILGTLLTTLPNSVSPKNNNDIRTNQQIAELILNNLESEDFSHPFHRIVFTTVKKIYDPNNKILGLETIITSIPKTPFGYNTGFELNDQINKIMCFGNLYCYELALECIRILKQNSILKKICYFSEKFIQNAQTQGISENDLISFQNKFNELINTDFFEQWSNSSYWSIANKVDEFKEKIKLFIKKLYEQTVQTNCWEINNLIGGWKKKGLIIIGARPGIGKTTFALNLALRAQHQIGENEIVVFFSLEMDIDEILSRIMSICLNHNFSLNKENNRIWNESEKQNINKVLSKIKSFKLSIIDQVDLSINKIKKHLQEIKNHGQKVKLIVIDYLQLVNSSFANSSGNQSMNRYLEVSAVSKGLKNIAREWEIPVIACAQLKRSVDEKIQKNPQLSDLKDSGNIEQDADIVSVLYKDEFALDNSTIVWEILKNRQGHIGKINFHFDREKSLFETEREFRDRSCWNLQI